LDFIEDENLVYTFHFYEPHIFTHQKAYWEPLMKELDFKVAYPIDKESCDMYAKLSADFKKQYDCSESMGKEYLRQLLAPALDFAKKRNVRLYCGEYGVIDNAPMDFNLRWHQDLCDILKENKIGRAVWTYKMMDFPMVDNNSLVREEKLIRIVSGK
jgi:hypothetical protein